MFRLILLTLATAAFAAARFVAIAPPARYERQIADAKQRLAVLGP